MKLSKLIRQRRIELGMSQLKLSKLLGYSEPYFLSNIENGRCKFPMKKLRRLRKALFIDDWVLVDSLIHEERLRLYKILGYKHEGT